MNEEPKRESGENPETENEKLPGQPAAEGEISDEALDAVAAGSMQTRYRKKK